MQVITTTDHLALFCADCASAPYVTVDTEFLRERTYWAQLCLVQVARPGDGEEAAAIVDPLAPGIDLAPLLALMADERVVKVFHAARQDLEIFYRLAGRLPAPVFDSQIAAMVCGHGDQASYESLVRRVAKAEMDKSARFTDWSTRPLSEKQLAYALADVTHLRVIYERLSEQLAATGRTDWVAEELAQLTAPETYRVEPDEAWMRLKTRTTSPKFLAVVRELAAWRERAAQERDVPRNRLLKDDALLEIASNRPTTMEELYRARLLQREGRRTDISEAILRAVKAGIDCPPEDRPRVEEGAPPKPGGQALADLLRVLLKAKADEAGVAARLIASSSDLDRIAGEEAPDVPALAGWRLRVFGADALRLRDGRVALAASPRGVVLVSLPDAVPGSAA